MCRATRLLALTGLAASLHVAGPAVAAPPNPAFCYQLFNEYNKCNQQHQRRGGGWGGGGWGGGQQWRGGGSGGYHGYGDHGGYHGGYHGSGWDRHDDDGPYGRPRWRGRPRGQQGDCSRWLVAMSLNRCTE